MTSSVDQPEVPSRNRRSKPATTRIAIAAATFIATPREIERPGGRCETLSPSVSAKPSVKKATSRSGVIGRLTIAYCHDHIKAARHEATDLELARRLDEFVARRTPGDRAASARLTRDGRPKSPTGSEPASRNMDSDQQFAVETMRLFSNPNFS